ncbi:MAG: trypsin-like peptidase domain-containing protein, partial [Candidatus Levybacteria bacterium]|nr:trypsin-like peptidase domain-containing protein [Candidatus Levybacteria bacterium]
MRKLILIVVVLVVVLGIWNAFSNYFPNLIQKPSDITSPREKVTILSEESVVIDAVKKVGPSVVTISQEITSRRVGPSVVTISQEITSRRNFNFGPFPFFDTPQDLGPQDIGSGFVISTDGLIITNKHVVSEQGARYQIVTSDDRKFTIEQIFRDPLNDVAILKINPPVGGLKAVELGDSDDLQVGQFVIAIGTALGEFRSTVTTGVISGLGRGITAGN